MTKLTGFGSDAQARTTVKHAPEWGGSRVDKQDERLDIAGLGIEVVIRPTGAACAEGDLTYDVLGRPRGFITHPHLHVSQIERFEVIAGEMRVKLDRRTQRLGEGDRMDIPAGAAHRQLPGGAGPGHVRVTMSPAGRTEEFIRCLAQMSSEGQLNRAGLPRPVAGARLIRDFADTGHAAFPPLALQRMISAMILGDARPVRAIRSLVAAGARRLWREYAFVDEWDVAAPAPEVYAVLADARTYPRWWRPVYIAVDCDGPPVVGSIAYQHFKGRLPYHLRTRSEVVRLEPGKLIEAEIDGDLRGRGVWTLTPAGIGTHVRFDWTVRADRRLLQVLTPLLRPALRSNHSWAIARAIEGLEPYVLSRPRPILGSTRGSPRDRNLAELAT